MFMVQGMVWVMGSGISNTIRNDVTNKIGQERQLVAKKYAIMGIILTCIYSFVCAIIFWSFSKEIARMFIKIDTTLEILTPMIFYAGFRVALSGIIPSLSTILRIIGKVNSYTCSTFTFQFVA